MDGSTVRARYPRRSVPIKRRGKKVVENSTFVQGMVIKTAVCVSIILLVCLIRIINVPAANYSVERIKAVLTYDMEPGSIYKGIDDTINNVRNSTLIQKLFVKKNDTAGNEGDSANDGKGASGDGMVPESSGNNSLGEGVTDEEGEGNTASNTPASGNIASNSPAASNSNEAAAVGTPTSKASAASSSGSTKSLIDAVKQKYTFITPVAGPLSSPFGNRLHPIKKTTEFHEGIDIEANKGSSIKAAIGGEVIVATEDPSYGKYIKIESSGDVITLYAHCSSLIAKKGQQVKKGDIIAKVGDTGASLGAHLHFEVSKDGVVLNPLNFIKLSEN